MLSLPKILLFAVIVIAVIFGGRLLRNLFSGGPAVPGDGGKSGAGSGGEAGAVDLEACSLCGSYVDPAAGDCGKADCPYA